MIFNAWLRENQHGAEITKAIPFGCDNQAPTRVVSNASQQNFLIQHTCDSIRSAHSKDRLHSGQCLEGSWAYNQPFCDAIIRLNLGRRGGSVTNGHHQLCLNQKSYYPTTHTINLILSCYNWHCESLILQRQEYIKCVSGLENPVQKRLCGNRWEEARCTEIVEHKWFEYCQALHAKYAVVHSYLLRKRSDEK